MRISLIQNDIIWNNPEANIKRFEQLAEDAVVGGADLLVFPEMFTTGFSFAHGEEAARAEELSSAFLNDTAARLNVTVLGSMPDVSLGKDRPLNTIKVFGPDNSGQVGELGRYAKIHLFNFGGEGGKYRAGDAPLTLSIGGFRVSFFVCYDLRFPQFFAALAEKSDLFVIVANWPEVRQRHWEALLTARAIENQVYVAAVNRVGKGGDLNYIGGSRVISPRGEILSQLKDEEGILSHKLDIAEVARYRAEFPVLKDRRPECYRD